MTTTVPNAELNLGSVTRLLHREARLLDENRLHEWLNMLTDDVLYWVPLNPQATSPETLSIIFEDRFRVEARVWRIAEAGINHSQDPPSRTVRTVSNVELDEDESGPIVRFVTVLYEQRTGGQRLDGMRTFPIRCEYRLRQQETEEWLISSRKLTLMQADGELTPLTFLL